MQWIVSPLSYNACKHQDSSGWNDTGPGFTSGKQAGWPRKPARDRERPYAPVNKKPEDWQGREITHRGVVEPRSSAATLSLLHGWWRISRPDLISPSVQHGSCCCWGRMKAVMVPIYSGYVNKSVWISNSNNGWIIFFFFFRISFLCQVKYFASKPVFCAGLCSWMDVDHILCVSVTKLLYCAINVYSRLVLCAGGLKKHTLLKNPSRRRRNGFTELFLKSGNSSKPPAGGAGAPFTDLKCFCSKRKEKNCVLVKFFKLKTIFEYMQESKSSKNVRV